MSNIFKMTQNSITYTSFSTYSLPSYLSKNIFFAFAIEPKSIKFSIRLNTYQRE